MPNTTNRPLSPHMSVWRWQLNSITSIFVRITGNALIVAALMIVWWFIALAAGPESFARADGFLRSWFGDLVFLGTTLCLWYHFFGGLRHLVWDMGYGVNMDDSTNMAYIMMIGSVVMTLFTIIIL